MGTGRKTETFHLKEKSQKSYTVNGSLTARNLPKNDLGAVIFGCKNHTHKECVLKQLFGLPAPHFAYVKNVRSGLRLFLFNYSDRTLHGIFEASGAGKLNIDQYAWTDVENTDTTPYPAQVKVCIQTQCRPLYEEEFKPIILKNYYDEKHFWFELDKGQTNSLVKLFLSSPMPKNVLTLPNVPVWNYMVDSIQPSDTYEVSGEVQNPVLEEVSGSDQLNLKQSHGLSYASVLSEGISSVPRKWSEMVKTSSAPGTSNEGEVVPSSCLKQSMSDLSSVGWEYSCIPEPENCNEFFNTSSAPETSIEEKMSMNSNLVLSMSENSSIGWEPSFVTHNQEGHNTLAVVGDGGLHALLQEVQELKVIQLKQSMLIDSLGRDLVNSKFEVQQLKRRCDILESGSLCSRNFSEADGRSTYSRNDELVLIIGGYDELLWLSSLVSYSLSQDCTESLCTSTSIRSHSFAAKLNDELYIFGGEHGGVWYDTVESYNLTRNDWVSHPSLNQKKGYLAGASFHDRIFAVGGGNGISCFSEVEIYDCNIGKWVFTQSMHEKRFSPAAADINGTLYVSGGFDGTSYLRSVERYDPRERAWIPVGSMRSKRACHSMVAFDERLYALGGYDGSSAVSSMEVYDPRLGSWIAGESMSNSRVFFGSVVIGGKLYVIGGMDDRSQALDTVECYDGSTSWQVTELNSLGRRYLFSALVI